MPEREKKTNLLVYERRGQFGDDEEFISAITDDGHEERLDIALGKHWIPPEPREKKRNADIEAEETS